MNRIILADNQAIFRAGAARVIALEDDMRIVAQCDDLAASPTPSTPGAAPFFSSPPACNWTQHRHRHARAAGIRTIYIAENGSEVSEELAAPWMAFSSAVLPAPACWSVSAASPPDNTPSSTPTSPPSWRRTWSARASATASPQGDPDRRAHRPGIQEQAHRHPTQHQGAGHQDYLRSIYDKTGVSDRLELALSPSTTASWPKPPPTPANSCSRPSPPEPSACRRSSAGLRRTVLASNLIAASRC